MTKDEFRKFVAEKNESKNSSEPLDWSKEKDTYLKYLEILYSNVKSFLDEFVKGGKIEIYEKQIEIEEESIGKYHAKKMDITIGNKKVHLIPIGTQLIGCKGRVDMRGLNGLIKIVLVDSRMKSLRDHIKIATSIVSESKQPKEEKNYDSNAVHWKWRLLTAPPGGKYIEFNEENFLEALMELAHD
jgi:hypothetical protein